jgi:hypothetical protein
MVNQDKGTTQIFWKNPHDVERAVKNAVELFNIITRFIECSFLQLTNIIRTNSLSCNRNFGYINKYLIVLKI